MMIRVGGLNSMVLGTYVFFFFFFLCVLNLGLSMSSLWC